MPIKKAFNKRSTRNNIARKRKKFKPRQMNVTSETPEVRFPPNRTPEVREPPTKTNIETTTQEIEQTPNTKQVLLHEFKSDKLLCNRSIRLAIAYFFVQALDIPPPLAWTGRNGTITHIQRTLNIPKGSYGLILNVLQNVAACYKNGIEYTGEKDIEIENMRESRKIKAGSIEEEMIANWMEEGLGFRLTTMFLNEHLKEEGHEEIGVKSVYNAFNRLNPLITKIGKKPQQPQNIHLWAEARYNWVTQLLLRTKAITSEDLQRCWGKFRLDISPRYQALL